MSDGKRLKKMKAKPICNRQNFAEESLDPSEKSTSLITPKLKFAFNVEKSFRMSFSLSTAKLQRSDQVENFQFHE